jgi:hypothetical protein
MSIYEHLCRILNFGRAWHEGCQSQCIYARSISINENGLPFSAQRTELIVIALRRLAARLPELVEEVRCPLPLPEDPMTVLWIVKCPYWGAASDRFKNKEVDFVKLCLADETITWLNEIRKLNMELKQLYQARLVEERKSEELSFWRKDASLLIQIQTKIEAAKKVRSSLSDSKPLETQWLSFPVDCF